MTRFDARPLHSAIEGLIDECSGIAEPTMIQHWVDLIHGYVLRLASRCNGMIGCNALGTGVAHLRSLDAPRLAEEAGYSNEHLRRLCRRQLGRSPMQQVTICECAALRNCWWFGINDGSDRGTSRLSQSIRVLECVHKVDRLAAVEYRRKKQTAGEHGVIGGANRE